MTDLSKNSILQRFTTTKRVSISARRLWLIFQRTQYYSDSQHESIDQLFNYVVTDLSKNSILQRFTTDAKEMIKDGKLWLIFQRTQYYSDSQHTFTISVPSTVVTDLSKNSILQRFTTQHNCEAPPECCDWSFKELNITAIHNSDRPLAHYSSVVTDLSKNSILQRFTTAEATGRTPVALWLIFQRTQYYSDSQRQKAKLVIAYCCDWSFKELNITAIHNWKEPASISPTLWLIFQRTQYYSDSQPPLLLFGESLVVTDLSKNSILQRFTTNQ